MSKSVPSRRVIALLAAYVVVLQALLLPLSVAAGAPFANVLCVSSAGDVQTPLSHDGGCSCAAGCGMQCSSPALAGPLSISVAISRTPAGVMTPTLALDPAERVATRNPQVPRAPPAA